MFKKAVNAVKSPYFMFFFFCLGLLLEHVGIASAVVDADFTPFRTDATKLIGGPFMGTILAVVLAGEFVFGGLMKKEWIMTILSMILTLGLFGVLWGFINTRFSMLIM